jgi:hypothetical protein
MSDGLPTVTLYILFFLGFVVASILLQRRGSVPRMIWAAYWILTVLFIGFRHEIGTDWPNYMSIWDDQGDSFISALLHTEPAYYILMYLVKKMNLTIHWLNLLTSFIAITPVFYFSYRQKNRWIALMSIATALFVMSYIGYARQAPAIGLSIWATFRFLDKKFIGCFLILITASLFHNSAMILIIVFSGFILLQVRVGYKFAVLALLGLAWMIYAERVVGRITNYFDLGLVSMGALPRIVLVDIALIIAIIFRKALFNSRFEREVMLYFCCCGILASSLFFLDSIMADRLILYWLVIQIFVYGNLSSITVNNDYRVLSLVSIAAVNLSVLLVWLVYGTFSRDWIPYKNFLFS